MSPPVFYVMFNLGGLSRLRICERVEGMKEEVLNSFVRMDQWLVIRLGSFSWWIRVSRFLRG